MDISEGFYAHVDKVAKSTSYKWTDLDWEDIRQDMWVWLMENIPQLEQYQEDTHDDRDKKLRRVGTQVAVAEIHGYEQWSGQYIYGKDEVRAMLEDGLFFKNDDYKTATERVDLHSAMLMLKEDSFSYFNILVDKFVHGSFSGHPETLSRSLDKLTQLMNQIHNFNEYTYENGPGARTVLSNSASIGITGEWS